MEQLLKILEDNARLPIEDIATMLNKSPAEVAAMIDLARAQGIIKGYKTLVDWEKAGVNRVEAVIELNVSPKKSRGFDEIAATIAAFDEVESVLLMSGGYDLQLVIKGQTFQEIALFVAKRLSPLDDVLSTATHFVLRTYKKEGRLYQDEEIDETFNPLCLFLTSFLLWFEYKTKEKERISQRNSRQFADCRTNLGTMTYIYKL